MPQYEWRGASPFIDNRNDREIEPGDTVELDDHVAEPHPAFVEVEGGENSEADGGSDGEDDSDAGEAADESGTDGYTREELEAMDYADLRSLASDADTDAVDGKSTKEEIIGALAAE